MTDPETPPTTPGSRSRWMGAVAIVALLAGIGVAASQWSHTRPAPAATPEPVADAPAAPDPALPEGHPPLDAAGGMPPAHTPQTALPPGHPVLDMPSDAAHAGAMAGHGDPGYVSIAGMHALMQAGLPPTNRHVWVDEVEGVDVASLTASQRETFLRHANSEACVCGYTVAACRAFNPSCPVGPKRAAALLDSVCAGEYRNSDGLRARPKGAPPLASLPTRDASNRR